MERTRLNASSQTEHRKAVRELEEEIFSHLKLTFQSIDIPFNEEQTIHCVLVHSLLKENQKQEMYFLGHGFGGSSLMNFAIIEPLLAKGSVVLWEIRGMGCSEKLEQYQINSLENIQQFFITTLEILLGYFNPGGATFICHSFSAYLTLRFLIKYPKLMKKHTKQVILLSAVGITVEEQDYKSKIRSFSDIFHTIVSKIGWSFKCTYKSLMRTIFSCCKRYFIDNYLRGLELDEKGKEIMSKILHTLVALPDGSEPVFFDYFLPRVLPKVAIEPLIQEEPVVKVTLVYGGQGDWVDKSGPEKIAARFPERIRLLTMQGCDHNIIFHTSKCKTLFKSLFG